MSLFFVFLGDLFGILLKKNFLRQSDFLVLNLGLIVMWEHLALPQERCCWLLKSGGIQRFCGTDFLKKKKKSVIWHKTLLICQQEELGILNFFEDFLHAGKHNHFLWSVCHLRKSWTFKGFTLFSVFSYSFYWISCKTKSNLLFSEH